MALSQLPRDSYYVSSKTNMGTVGGKCTAEDFRKRLETTLTRLKVDYLDFYHLWCVLSLDAFEKQCDALYKFLNRPKQRA